MAILQHQTEWGKNHNDLSPAQIARAAPIEEYRWLEFEEAYARIIGAVYPTLSKQNMLSSFYYYRALGDSSISIAKSALAVLLDRALLFQKIVNHASKTNLNYSHHPAVVSFIKHHAQLRLDEINRKQLQQKREQGDSSNADSN